MLTQVGGFLYLLYQPLSKWSKKRYVGGQQISIRLGFFLTLYFGFTFIFIPPIAKQFGRVSLPYFATKDNSIKPLTIVTCLLNRQYVKPVLKDQIIHTAQVVAKEFPNTQIAYLDANFPFWNGFPLLPHLSHNDGKKLDLAFLYKDKITGKAVNRSPSFYGYGVFEAPQKGELNQPNICSKKGYWQ